ncbi:MAG: PaaI family thioesterase [Rhodobacterales bacterium]|nr:PaaI family thioesterase [Rhodobacterales bacterium]
MTNSDTTRTYSWADPAAVYEQTQAMDGPTYLAAVRDGRLPQAPMWETAGLRLADFADGTATFTADLEPFHGNAVGTIHAGFVSTILDTTLGCALRTTLPAGMGYTTLGLTLHLTRGLRPADGPVTCTATLAHRGRRTATAEGRLTDRDGRLCAHGTATLMLFTSWAERDGRS